MTDPVRNAKTDYFKLEGTICFFGGGGSSLFGGTSLPIS